MAEQSKADQALKTVSVRIHNKTKSPVTLYTGQAKRHSVMLGPGKRISTIMSASFYEAYRVRNATGVVVSEAVDEPPRSKSSVAPQGDSIERLLSEVDAESVNFQQLRSRSKTLLGDDFPAGTSPKKDDIVELLMQRQERDRAAAGGGGSSAA
jgi:hypothetical protein